MEKRPDTLLTIIGRNLRMVRMRTTALSQEQLAEACSLHRNYIGEIERGEANLTFETYERVCRALNVDPFIPLMREMDDHAPKKQ